jgi:hypothetical protein
MTNLTPSELTNLVRTGLTRVTTALLDGDARLAELVLRNDEVFTTCHPEDALWPGATHLKRIGGVTVELATMAAKRAPKGSVPDRLHPSIRAMAREADALITCAVGGRPVDPTPMNRLVNDVLTRAQSDGWQYSTPAARRTMRLGQAYAAIAEHTAAMSGTRRVAYETQVA